ncbi:FtsX-like permease family protein [Longispora sp. K20-0274]|uniref:ABC transporter permease n=1 Tax=Longispora sp. K20-0274 TaxID=3088255 RepID=UPI00399B4A5A
MRAVWRASRAAVKRRRPQTFVIGLVVLCSTTMVLLATALLAAASGPFDQAFAEQHGAHAVATFDRERVTDDQLAQTAHRPGVEAAAGPFAQATLDMKETWLGRAPGSLLVVGRADPAGPVDQVELLSGRWPTGPGEIVINSPHGEQGVGPLGSTLTPEGVEPLTVVGFATSISKSAGAWVTPEQVKTLHPTATQMLYRFTSAGTDAQVEAGLASATTGLPADALTDGQSHLTLRRAFSALADAYLPFMTVFGVLGLAVSVLIVGNVVSGAVVSGYRHIGVLKALGFTPNQVVAVYLTMLSVPAIAGSILGTIAGTLLADPVLKIAFAGIETGTITPTTSSWIPIACLLGMPLLVLLTALVPASRAHRLSAARAISAGSAPRTGRGLRVQRWLSRSRLPRSVSMGLGLPFTRPGRAGLTMAAIVLGVMTVTLTTGLTATMVAFGESGHGDGPRVQVYAEGPQKLTDPQLEQILRAQPGAQHVTVRGFCQVGVVGQSQTVYTDFIRTDDPSAAEQIVRGRQPAAAGEVVVGPTFLTQHGLDIGDQLTLERDGVRATVTIVGELIEGNARAMTATWQTQSTLAPDIHPTDFTVQLAPGTDPQAFIDAVKAADPQVRAATLGGNTGTTTVVGFSTVFTILLTIVTALGVFNTVLLNIRERRRDLGMLKSIGMTPRQVVTMTVASVAGLGVVGGLLGIPLGIIAHRLIVDNVGVVAFPESMKDVWHAPQLAGLALAGLAIAVLGALIPARSAARATIATVLHTE